VAIQLGSGSTGESALALAQRLIAECGGVAGLARADPVELATHRGVGPAKAVRLVSAFALADRCHEPSAGLPLRTSADIAAVARPLIGRARVETVVLVVADSQHRVCRVLTVAQGGATSSVVPVRDVVALALRHDGVAFAVAHNHPSGSVEPSPADLKVTERLRGAAETVGLHFLDHVIVSGDQWKGLTASH